MQLVWKMPAFGMCQFQGRGAIFALLCAAAFLPNALLADKTTNVFTRTSSQAASLGWKASGVPNDYGTTTGLDVSLKIDYAEGAEKFQQLDLPKATAYFDSVVGGDYHALLITNSVTKYMRINDPTPFNGYWAMKDSAGASKDAGLFLPDNGGAGSRTIGSAFLKGRFPIGVATGCEAFFDYPFGLGAFTVNRSMDSVSTATVKGKLTVSSSPGPYSIAQVHNGTLGIVGGDADISSPVSGAWVRFDASAEDSFTMSGTAITEWRDANGGPVSAVKDGNSSPTLYTDPETEKKSVNFGAFVNYAGATAGDKTLHGSGARLALSETNDVAEMFVVFKDNDLINGAYPQIVGEAFPRRTGNSDPNKLFKPRGELPAGLSMGEFRLDGQAVIPDFYYDFSRRMNVVSASYRDGGGEVFLLASPNNDGHSNYTKGGIKIAEIILYTNKLTSAQRRHNNDYLMKKWLGHGVRDYGAIMLEKPASLSVESGTARVRELNLATNGFVKAGAGTLEIESLTTNLNGLAVNGGGVRFVSTLARPAAPQPPADALAWFDASDADTLATVVSNYNDTSYTFVTNWYDKRNNGYTLHSPRLGSSPNYAIYEGGGKTDEPAWPTLDESTGAHPMVDLGPWVNPCSSTYKGHFGWINGISGLTTWLCLYTSSGGMYGSYGIREEFVVFYKTDSRGNPINSTDWALRNAGGDEPKTKFLHNTHAAGAAIGGHWTYDGVTVNPVDVRGGLYADGKTHLGAFRISEVGVPANVFGSDQSGGNSAGGCKIAEVILYTRVLTEQERLDTERYLMAKWNCETHPADKAPTVGTMTFNNGTQAVIDTDFNMTIGTVAGSGAVVKRGSGTATVGAFAQDVSALSLEGGSLAVESNMTLADGAALDVYFDESTNVVGTAAIAGTLTVGGSATVRLHVPEGVELGYGEYEIMTATSVAASGAHWSVDDAGGAHKGVARVGFDSSRNAIILNVGHSGLMIFIR